MTPSMLPDTINTYLLISALLFAIGFFGVLVRRNTLARSAREPMF